MKIKDTIFYKVVRPIVSLFIKIFYPTEVVGLENIPKTGPIVLAGNHTKWLNPVMLVGITKRQIHFLAKDSLFKGITKPIVKGMGCVPVNRKIHDKEALETAYNYLEKGLCIGIFPEGTINRTSDIIMPFKMGAVKMCHKTNASLVPFVITGKYKMFRKHVKIEFLKPRKISSDLEKENNELMTVISKKLEKGDQVDGRKYENI
jgi:1-acyl-sn-glycerol-3-phosphate acyltransferase